MKKYEKYNIEKISQLFGIGMIMGVIFITIIVIVNSAASTWNEPTDSVAFTSNSISTVCEVGDVGRCGYHLWYCANGKEYTCVQDVEVIRR